MNRKLFGRDGRQAQLQDLYRQVERGGDLRDVDPELQRAFAADQHLMQQLGRLADESAPTNPAVGRATLLAAVAQKRSGSVDEERRPMIGRLLTGRALALLATAGIFAGGAVTVGASGGVSGAADNVLSALHITDRTTNNADTHVDGTDHPDGSGTPAAEGTTRAVAGIPTENPQHQPAAASATCGKGETIVKTTASGVAVDVPCQTGQDHGQGSDDKTPVPNDTPDANATEPNKHSGEADKTPEADAAAPHDGSGERTDRTPVPLPTQENPHATEGAGNATDH
jgi:hypothetical protein